MRTGITALPTEILLWIFHLLSSAGRRNPFSMKHYTSHINNPHLCDCDHAWAPEIFPSRCTLFPYAQSQVCRHWRDVLLMHPTFWTRVIVSRKPGHHTPPKLFEKYLQWSRDLQIEVYVGSVRDERLFPSERPLVREYTKILLPHVRRCNVIDYEVQCSTSLPCLVADLRTMLPFLESLKLKSEQIMDSEDPPTEEYPTQGFHSIGQQIAQTAQRLTSLNHIALNGRNFLLACAYIPELIMNNGSILVENYRRSLHLHPEIDSIPFQFLRMITLLKRVKEIRFVDLEFQAPEEIRTEIIDADPPPLTDTVALQVDKIELNNVHPLMVIQFMEYTQFAVQTLVILDSINFSQAFPNVSFLFRRVELRHMEWNAIYFFLWHWNGATLSLRDCPGLTGDVIHGLGLPSSAGRLMPLRELEIHSCHNFSVGCLKEMMASRHRFYKNVSEGQFQSALLAFQAEVVPKLAVRGAKEHLSDEDRSWFNRLYSLCHFEWDTLDDNLAEAVLENDTEDPTTGDGYSHIQEELDGQWYTAPQLVVDYWPLREYRRSPSPADESDDCESLFSMDYDADFFLTDEIRAMIHDPSDDTMDLS
ncbi:hypothetical protein M413DRAFT_192448 [Hebeloma cylindrosporum]|uniref:Uncharacterized protein n=1 Tax=Hebeloma cylindrosporum TaxID=76867 RepID=A0A0C2XPE1_HEBCY|nr:hypothetical protein M413DRAFT_192448 [Hebeloma cylindrosporum h7]